MKRRELPECNYRAIYINGKTLRMPIDPRKPITELTFPEFYDVKITDACNGNCKYCYQESTQKGKHFEDIVKKTYQYFGSMTENQRPFQVAIGGGEPTLHPEFPELCRVFKSLGIDPNYTTNGMHLTNEVMDATVEYCNGVAVTCHAHLPWARGVHQLLNAGVFTNLHVLISDKRSVDAFRIIHDAFKGDVKYFVLLPMIKQGRSQQEFDSWDYLSKVIDDIGSIDDIAFGAMFFPYIQESAKKWDISIYEPEMMSKYLVMDDMKMHPSSFNVGG